MSYHPQGKGSKKNSSEWAQSGVDSMGRTIYKKITGNVLNSSKKKRDIIRKNAMNPMGDTRGGRGGGYSDRQREEFYNTINSSYINADFDDEGRVTSIITSDGSEYSMQYYNLSDDPEEVKMSIHDMDGNKIADFSGKDVEQMSTIYTLQAMSGFSSRDDSGKMIDIDDSTISSAYMDAGGDITIHTNTGYRIDYDYDVVSENYTCYITSSSGETVKMDKPLEEEELAMFTNELLQEVKKENRKDVKSMAVAAAGATGAYYLKKRGRKRFGRGNKGDRGNDKGMNAAEQMAGGVIFGPVLKWLEKGLAPMDSMGR